MPRTALITGASRGLGFALARGLATRGWELILTARDADRLAAVRDELSAATRVSALAGDVTDPAHRVALADLVRGRTRLDALINNAGALGPSPQPPLLDYPLAVLRSVFETNVLAPLALLQTFAPTFSPDARVINVTSDAAVTAYAGWGGYGASKSALDAWTAVFALENPRLRVYAIDPGDLRTDMQQSAFPGEDISDRALPHTVVPAFLTLLEGELPSGRYVAADLLSPALEAV